MAELVEHPAFEGGVLLMILVSSVLLVIEFEFSFDKSHRAGHALSVVDYIITTIFVIELIIRSIVQGFFFGEKSFWKSGWNRIDFVSTLMSILAIIFGDSFKAARAARCVRALRSVRRVAGLRVVIDTLLLCAPSFINIFFLAVMVLSVFGILGVQLWSGKMWICKDQQGETLFGVDVNGCDSPNEWKNADMHFDNIGSAMLTLFEVASLELWLDVMYSTMDTPDDLGGAPERNSKWFYSLYFVIYICVGSFLILNLFISAVVDTFETERDKATGMVMLTEPQEMFVLSMRQVAALVYSNVATMCMYYWTPPSAHDFPVSAPYEAHKTYNQVLDKIQWGFLVLFIIEAVVRIVGLGWHQYWSSYWNKFDFGVAVLSTIAMIAEITSPTNVIESALSPAFLRTLRALRIFPLGKAIRRYPAARRLLETLLYSLPGFLNVAGVLLLVLYIYAILGMAWFGDDEWLPVPGNYYTVHANFSNFGSAMMLLFRMTTGESWNGVMFQVMEEHPMAWIYFVSFQFIGAYLVMNLLSAIVLSNFSEMCKQEAFPISPDQVQEYADTWGQFDPLCTNMIHVDRLPELLHRLKPPLGFACCAERSEPTNGDEVVGSDAVDSFIQKQLPLAADAHVESKIHFVEVFMALIKFQYGMKDIMEMNPVQIHRVAMEANQRYSSLVDMGQILKFSEIANIITLQLWWRARLKRIRNNEEKAELLIQTNLLGKWQDKGASRELLDRSSEEVSPKSQELVLKRSQSFPPKGWFQGRVKTKAQSPASKSPWRGKDSLLEDLEAITRSRRQSQKTENGTESKSRRQSQKIDNSIIKDVEAITRSRQSQKTENGTESKSRRQSQKIDNSIIKDLEAITRSRQSQKTENRTESKSRRQSQETDTTGNSPTGNSPLLLSRMDSPPHSWWEGQKEDGDLEDFRLTPSSSSPSTGMQEGQSPGGRKQLSQPNTHSNTSVRRKKGPQVADSKAAGDPPVKQAADEKDERASFMLELRENASRLFHRYDLDESGTVNSQQELQQITINLAFTLELTVRYQAMQQAIDSAMLDKLQEDWDVEKYISWFVENVLSLASPPLPKHKRSKDKSSS